MTRSNIPTPSELRRLNRRANRLRRDVDRTLAAMKDGAVLQLHHQRGRGLWRLSTGTFVTPEAAAVVTASRDVVSVGASLFPGLSGQAWRYCE